MLDAVICMVLENLIEHVANRRREMLEFGNELETLESQCDFLLRFLKDVENVKIKDRKEILKKVVQDVRELSYDADDIISEHHMFQKQKRRKLSDIIRSVPFCRRDEMQEKLEEINKKIGKLMENVTTFLGPALSLPNEEDVGGSRPTRYPVLINDDEIVGLDKDLEKIKQSILEETDGPLKVIGIVGMGGIGKTTLAQKICNNKDVKDTFKKHVLFVTVSQKFQLKEIIKVMLKRLDVKEDSLRGDEHGLLEQLRDQLEGKKYLVVLDDVWQIHEGFWWESLKSALYKSNNGGGCIIVTTRKNDIALLMGAIERHIHRPEILSDENSWLLFSKIAFAREDGRCLSPYLEAIGKEMVAKCGGLPLAIKVVAGMMLGKEPSIHKWEQMSQNLKEDLANRKEGEEVVSMLQLSYEDLPPHLKACMLCFAFFPEDSEMDLHEMVHLWTSEGFVRRSKEKTAYEIGEECFDELHSRCLLLGVEMNIFETRYHKCRVHDMVRDMIMRIAKEESFMDFDDRGVSFCPQSRRVGIMKTSNLDRLAKTSSKLRTLVGREILEGTEFILDARKKLGQLELLRVLDLSFKTSYSRQVAEDWLSGIGSLRLLTYLKIEDSSLERLPKCIEMLQNLRTLCLSGCHNLKRLPAEITCLKKLSILDVSVCDSLEYLPTEIENLSNLEQLWGFKPARSRVKGRCRMSGLVKLTQLRRLWIVIDSGDQIEERELDVLSKLEQLEVLAITFGNECIDEQLVKKVDCEVSPLKQLRQLTLHFFPGEVTPAWLNPTTLPNLRFLYVYQGNITRMHPRFFGKREENRVWKLEVLVLGDLRVSEASSSRMQEAMPCLRLSKF